MHTIRDQSTVLINSAALAEVTEARGEAVRCLLKRSDWHSSDTVIGYSVGSDSFLQVEAVAGGGTRGTSHFHSLSHVILSGNIDHSNFNKKKKIMNVSYCSFKKTCDDMGKWQWFSSCSCFFPLSISLHTCDFWAFMYIIFSLCILAGRSNLRGLRLSLISIPLTTLEHWTLQASKNGNCLPWEAALEEDWEDWKGLFC